MCIQDPTELNHNVTAYVSDTLLDVFQKHCSVSAKVCSNALKHDCSQLFLNLFTTMPDVSKSKAKRVVIPIILVKKFHKVGLPDDFDTRTDILDKGQFIRDNWYKIIFNIVKDFFERVMKLKVELATIDREQKQQKIETESDVHTQDNQKIVLKCTGDRCLWTNRQCNSLALDPSISILEKEAIISDRMLKDTEQCGINKVDINLKCIFEKKLKPLQVDLILSDNNNCGKVFSEFANFLRCKIPSTIERTLLHMIQYKKNTITFESSHNININN